VAIRVTGLREAERYYRTIFGLQVAFREAEVADGWRTLPVGAEWEDTEAAGIPLSMCFLARDGFRLALEEAPKLGPDQGKHPFASAARSFGSREPEIEGVCGPPPV
jgi:hypothetical protein